jgi:hypothetical protein
MVHQSGSNFVQIFAPVDWRADAISTEKETKLQFEKLSFVN